MNIFVLDLDPVEAAKCLCDKHVNKMLLESCQIMATVHHLQNSSIADAVYAPTHENHPCVQWTRAYRQNYAWLFKHARQLAKEYTLRYDKEHACETELLLLKKFPPGMRSSLDDTTSKFVCAMPDVFIKNTPNNPIADYRRYYHYKETVMDMHWLRGRPKPSWWGHRFYVYNGELDGED